MKLRGLKNRWMFTGIGVTVLIVLMGVWVIAASIYSNYYRSVETGLESKATTASEFFSTYVSRTYAEFYQSACRYTEGFEDRARFGIMQKVGMTKEDIRRSINAQMLLVFLLPLVTAVIHLAFAFPMVRKLLMIFNLTNLPLLLQTAGISVLIFAAFYILVYRLTSNAYCAIVSGAGERRS